MRILLKAVVATRYLLQRVEQRLLFSAHALPPIVALRQARGAVDTRIQRQKRKGVFIFKRGCAEINGRDDTSSILPQLIF